MTQCSEERLLLRKAIDKAKQALNNGYTTHTNFLDLYEQDIILSHIKELPPVSYSFFGGYDESERKILIFYADDLKQEEINYPLMVLHIQLKSNIEKLTHRDYLGALMNLGIERNKMGDILCDEHGAYVICMNNIACYIAEQLFMVKKTNVNIKIEHISEFKLTAQSFQLIKGTVSSLRLDNIIKLSFSISRGQALELIKSKKAYINSRLVEKGSVNINEGTTISLRGYGKVKLRTIGDLTKKGRTYVEILKYK